VIGSAERGYHIGKLSYCQLLKNSSVSCVLCGAREHAVNWSQPCADRPVGGQLREANEMARCLF
jgi:hypothetical protein